MPKEWADPHKNPAGKSEDAFVAARLSLQNCTITDTALRMLPRGEYGVAACPSRNAETLRYPSRVALLFSPTGNSAVPRDAWRSKGAGLPPDQRPFSYRADAALRLASLPGGRTGSARSCGLVPNDVAGCPSFVAILLRPVKCSVHRSRAVITSIRRQRDRSSAPNSATSIVFEESGGPIRPRPRGSWALEPEMLS